MSSHAAPQPLTARKSEALTGTIDLPGDKSVSHRALILAAMTVGQTRITGLLEGEDVIDTASAMRALGADVQRVGDGEWLVDGVGVGGFSEPEDVIDCGNSGTGVRLLMGAVATTDINVTFTGDSSLNSRPMRRVTDPLELFGATVTARKGGRLPLTITGAKDALPVHYVLPVPSAQVKSAILLAGLNAPGETVVIEAEATRDHTELMLRGFGAEISVEETDEGRKITLQGRPELRPCTIAVPRDPSSAAFPAAAALIVPGSRVVLPGISRNPTRDGFFRTLEEMGAPMEWSNNRSEGGEPVADLVISYGPLKGVEVPAGRAPSMIDEYPILAALAAYVDGTVHMPGIGEMRVKECDRIDAMARGLEANGVRIEETPTSLTVHGTGSLTGGATVESRLDHRIAMSFLIAALGADNPITVDDAGPIATSFPDFVPLMQRLGADIG